MTQKPQKDFQKDLEKVFFCGFGCFFCGFCVEIAHARTAPAIANAIAIAIGTSGRAATRQLTPARCCSA